jgi:aspartate-semialdehyde dehydrogenase
MLVGRLRQVPIVAHGTMHFISSDNLREGAALNAVQMSNARA